MSKGENSSARKIRIQQPLNLSICFYIHNFNFDLHQLRSLFRSAKKEYERKFDRIVNYLSGAANGNIIKIK